MIGMACLPVLICALILTTRKNERPATLYLAGFFIVAILAVGPQIIGYSGFYDKWPNLTYFPLFATELWFGPLIYLHADRLMRNGPLGWRKWLLLPGIIQLFYYTVIFFRWNNHQDKWAYNAKFHAPYVMPTENILTIALMVFAVIGVWKLMRTYRTYLEKTSSAALDYDPVWLRNLFYGLLVAGGIFTGLELADILTSVSYNAAFPFQVLTIALIVWIAIEAVWRLNKPFPKLEGLSPNEDAPESKNWGLEARKLQDKIVAEKWFLEPRLSVRDVASRMATNESYVSKALNQGLEQSFNQFINGLRIDHAKSLMESGDDSMLNIGFDSGFNSKATFNRVFKEMTGQTPTQYRAQYKKSQNP